MKADRPRQSSAPMTLEERLAADLAMTGGTMPLGVVVADEDERTRAVKWLEGRRHAKLLSIVTQAEHEAGRARR
jgi:hypothetical protein